MKISLFDYRTIPNNPIGSCNLRYLHGLSSEHEFTIYSVECAQPLPENSKFIPIKARLRPLVLLFLQYHFRAFWIIRSLRRKNTSKSHVIQVIESKTLGGDIAYAHFCHRSFLKLHFSDLNPGGLRGLLRYLDHKFHALLEPRVYKQCKEIVVPSQGLRRELVQEYPFTIDKITVIPNAVDVRKMLPPVDFSSEEKRAQVGFSANDLVFVFVALGQFERKGLPLIIEAVANLPATSRVKILVVGGEPDLVQKYREICVSRNLAERIAFVGMQSDVRPYLWLSDAFIFPSAYEVFPLVSLEAAAAGLPLLVSRLNGVEEFLRDGENGFQIEREAGSIARVFARLEAMSREEIQKIGENARFDVQKYSSDNFVEKWRIFYNNYAHKYQV